MGSVRSDYAKYGTLMCVGTPGIDESNYSATASSGSMRRFALRHTSFEGGSRVTFML